MTNIVLYKGWWNQASQTLTGAACKPVPTPATTTTTSGTTIPAAATFPWWHTHAVWNVLAFPERQGMRRVMLMATHQPMCAAISMTLWGGTIARRCAPRAVLALTGQPRSNNSSSPFSLKGKSLREQREPSTGTAALPPAQELTKTGHPPSRRSGPTLSLDLVPPSLGEHQNKRQLGGNIKS